VIDPIDSVSVDCYAEVKYLRVAAFGGTGTVILKQGRCLCGWRAMLTRYSYDKAVSDCMSHIDEADC